MFTVPILLVMISCLMTPRVITSREELLLTVAGRLRGETDDIGRVGFCRGEFYGDGFTIDGHPDVRNH